MYRINKKKVEYKDSKIIVETGLTAESENLQHSSCSAKNNLIKIIALSQGAHFIQFITRQVLNTYAFKNLKTTTGSPLVKWFVNKYDPIYMSSALEPKWKLDHVAKEDCSILLGNIENQKSKTIYYEEKGASKKTGKSIAIYDQPDGSFDPLEERAVACTFVVISNKVTHLIQWSFQRNMKEEKFYLVNVIEQNYLSHWAVKLIDKKYNYLAKKSLGYSKLLKSQPKIKKGFNYEIESKKDFLIWPKNWITCTDQKFCQLFKYVNYEAYKQGIAMFALQNNMDFCDTQVLCHM